MARLSWQRDGVSTFTSAADIYPLSDLNPPLSGVVEYEVLEPDAEVLVAHVGTSYRFYINEQTGTFLAKIGPLSPVTSTHPGLALIREKATLRGYLEIIDGQAAT